MKKFLSLAVLGSAVVTLTAAWSTEYFEKREVIGNPALEAVTQGDGLRGTYFKGSYGPNARPVEQIDATIDFVSDGTVRPAPGVRGENFSARWNGYVKAPETGELTLVFRADDGLRFWVNDVLQVDAWHGQEATSYTVSFPARKDHYYELKIEYFQLQWDAVAQLSWVRNGRKEIVPQQYLYSSVPESNHDYMDNMAGGEGQKSKSVGLDGITLDGEVPDGTGLNSVYHRGQKLNRPVYSQLEPTVDHYWDYERPVSGLGSENFSINWNGYLRAPMTGNYRIAFAADDGVDLELADKMLFRTWEGRLANLETEWVYLKAGEFYPINIDFLQMDFDATAKLKWSFEGRFETIIPTQYLYPELPQVLPEEEEPLAEEEVEDLLTQPSAEDEDEFAELASAGAASTRGTEGLANQAESSMLFENGEVEVESDGFFGQPQLDEEGGTAPASAGADGDRGGIDANGIVQQEARMKVFPNPTRGNFNLEVIGAERVERVEMIDGSGSVVQTWSISRTGAMREQLTLDQLPAGYYTVRAKTEQGWIAKRILLQ